MAKVVEKYDEDCGCRKCSTWATITEYSCGCITVNIHQDTKPCAECTNFSGKKEYCGQNGHPNYHD